MPELEIRDVTFRINGMDMRFNLAVEAGSCTALIGASGAGKSTLLALVAGFEQPGSGSIRYDGREISKLPPDRRPVATMFQDHNLFPHLSIRRNVGLGVHPGLRLDKRDLQRVDAAIERTGLAALRERLPGELSGGERQRAALATALVQRRPLLLLDEPFAALGPALRDEMLDFVDSIRRDDNRTVLLVSHQPSDARRVAERTAFIHAGRVLREGLTADLLDRPDEPELRAYLRQQYR